jgi:hypothetical protein
MIISCIRLLYFSFLGTLPLHPQSIKVNSVPSLQLAINSATPGDIIVVANGAYTTSESITISKKGTKDKPIKIEAETN